MGEASGLAGHLAFIGVYMATAVAAVVTVLGTLVSREPAGLLVRVSAMLTALGAVAATVLAAQVIPGLPLGVYGPDPAVTIVLVVAAFGLTTIVAAATVEEPRGAALLAVVLALAVSGVLLYLMLYAGAADKVAAFGWEAQRCSVYAASIALGGLVASLFIPTVSLRRPRLARVGAIVSGASNAVALAAAVSLSGGAALKSLVVVAAFMAPFVGYWLWLLLRTQLGVERPNRGSESNSPEVSGTHDVTLFMAPWRDRAAAALWRWSGHLRRLPSRRVPVLLLCALPILLGTLALVFAKGGSAREAARVTVGGLAFTPALLVPFAFAPALGLLLGGRAFRGTTLWAFGLTALTVLLLVAQKEIGYTAVCLAVAAATFLVTRGNFLQLALGAGTGVVAVGLAFELQPILPAIPFTVRERILMWMGGASLARRGGHLLIADRVTYDVGGFHGVGLHTTLGFEPMKVVNSLDTDFPLAALGLYGGFPWLLAYVLLFVALALLLFDIARRHGRATASANKHRMAVLLSLAAVPVASTVINVSGGLTHLTPFAGVPAAFLSYGSFFIGGTLAIVLTFFIASQRRSLAMRLRHMATDELQLAELPQWQVGSRLATTGVPRPEPLWRNPSWAGIRLAMRRLVARLRGLSVNAGAAVLMLSVTVLGVLWATTLHARFTDQPQVETHPALAGTSVRIRPLAPNIWDVPVDPDEAPPPPGWGGVLEAGKPYRLNALEFSFQDGYLRLHGGCWPYETATTRGISVGFEGLLDGNLGALSGMASSLMSGRTKPNDLVLPLSPVALHHLRVRRLGEGRFEVAAIGAGQFVVHNVDGDRLTRPRGGTTVVPAGYSIALADSARLRLTIIDRPAPENSMTGEVCLLNPKLSLMKWRMSRWRHTLVGGPELLRRAPVERSVDFEFAEDLKRAAEAGLVRLKAGRLWVTPWDAESRAQWSSVTRRQFFRVFRIRKRRGGSNSVSESGTEVLHWVRQFYDDGGSRVRFDDGLAAFSTAWDSEKTIAGLADPFRFSRKLPASAHAKPKREHGVVLDRNGAPLATFDTAAQRWRTTAEGAGALLGYGFAQRGVYGGVLRVFRKLLHGRPVRVSSEATKVGQRRDPRDNDFIGVDVELTLDRELQRALQTIIDEEARTIWELALGRGDANWRPRARILVLGQDNAILAAVAHPSFEPHSLKSVLKVTANARKVPREAPGLDAWQRTTTVGSTAKIGVLLAAARDPQRFFRDVGGRGYGRTDLCIEASDDPANADRSGCFLERGRLTSVRGVPVAAVFNSGNSYIGGVTTVRRLIMKSENTSAAYLAGRLGLDAFKGYYTQLGAGPGGHDLLPTVLGLHPRFSTDIERWPRDPLRADAARLGELPRGDTWRLDYTVRLALSGFSDLSLLHVGLSTSIAARDGRHYPPFLVSAMRDRRDDVRIAVNPPAPQQVVPVRVARYLKAAMVDTVMAGTAQGMKRYLRQGRLYREVGAKTGTAETVRLDPFAKQNPNRRKIRTQDHKFATGFWPKTSREPFVVVAAFEHASHLDKRVAVRMLAKAVLALQRRFEPPPPKP